MNTLKHLSIFEKFESVQLSKILKFINKEDRSIFLDKVKWICKSIDFPISSLSEDLFQYLPFKSALNVKSAPVETKCKTCDGEGRYRRVWGKGMRTVSCSDCSSTGKISPKSGEITYVKFWFNSDGNYVGATVVDGVMRVVKVDPENNIELYDQIKELSFKDLTSLNDGDIILINIGGSPLIARIFKYGGTFYIVHNDRTRYYNALPRDESRKWSPYGQYGIIVYDSLQYAGSPILLSKKAKDPIIVENPYDWNAVATFGDRYTTSLFANALDVEKYLRSANFALILDFKKLKSKEFKPITNTKNDRIDQKKGSLFLTKPEDIKKANIEKYINQLVLKLKLDKDFSGSVEMIARIFGGQYSLFFISNRYKFDDFTYLIDEIFSIMSDSTSVEDKKYYIGTLSNRLRSLYKFSLTTSSSLTNNLKYINDKFLKEGQKSIDNVDIIKECVRIGKKINSKILDHKIESLFDLENLKLKIDSIYSFCHGRFGISNLSRILDYTKSYKDDAFYAFLGISKNERDNLLKNLKYLDIYIDKL